VPEYVKKFKKGGLGQYGAERFGRLILPQSEKCGTKRVKDIVDLVLVGASRGFGNTR